MNSVTNVKAWDYIVSTKIRIDKFYNTWTKRYIEFDDGFDKFISIYIGYNSLYEATTRLYLLEGIISYDEYQKKYKRFEIERASTIMAQLLESKATTIMRTQIIRTEIPEIEKIITESNYYFDFRPIDQGLFLNLASQVLPNSNIPNKTIEKVYEESDDNNLLNSLQSNDPNESLKSLLKLLYKVRCNIFHGNKTYQSEMSRRVERYADILNSIYSESYIEWNLLSDELKSKYYS